MAISIKNEATETLARQVSAITGESITDAIRESLQERFDRLNRTARNRMMREEIRQIVKLCPKANRRTEMTDDELLGYDEFGAPTK